MESVADLMEAITISNYEVGSSHWVDVSHINNPHDFYVRPTKYRRYMAVLHSYGNPLDSSELQLQQKVVYKSKLTRTFIRGRILFIQTEGSVTTCDIYAIDYGCMEKSIPLKKIHKPLQTDNVPPLAIHCKLAHCQPNGETWTSEITDTMKSFVGKERALMVIEEKKADLLIVELHNSCREGIALMLAYCGYSTMGYNHSGRSSFYPLTGSQVPQHYMTHKKVNVGDELTVRLQFATSLKSFFVATVTDFKFYLNQKELVDSLSQKQEILRDEDVKIGLPVAVFDVDSNNYERAVVKEISENKVKVQLVDWGQDLEVPYNVIKPMSEHLLTYPGMAIYCCAEKNQLCDFSLHRIFHPGYEFKIVIIATGNLLNSPSTVKISLKHSKK